MTESVPEYMSSLDELLSMVEQLKNKRIFVLFTGTPSAQGVNWCSDCVEAKPILTEALKKLPPNGVFLTVHVGDRPTWRDPNNGFRKHAKCSISSIPTLIEFGTAKRLSHAEILQPALIEMLLEEE